MKLTKIIAVITLLISLSILSFFGTQQVAHAAPGCAITDNSVGAGDAVPITHGEFPAGRRIAFFGGINTNVGQTQDSTAFLVNQNLFVPSVVADGLTFHVVIEYPAGTLVTCTGGPVTINNAASIPTTPTCSGFFDCLTGIDFPSTAFPAFGIVGGIINVILPMVYVFAGFISIIVIVISGIQFISSNGNPEGAAAARGRLMYAIIGLIIIILAFALTQIVDIIFLGNTNAV